MQKRPSYHIFHFSRKEKNGSIFILFIILLLTIIPFIYPLIFKERQMDINEFKNEMAALKSKPADTNERAVGNNYFPKEKFSLKKKDRDESTSLSLFYFDPNTISKEGWQKMGLRDKAIATIQNYLSKGGRFRDPADIKKIWGLQEEEIAQMLPYIRIEQQAAPARNFPAFEKRIIHQKQ
jgi:competence protein ComEA